MAWPLYNIAFKDSSPSYEPGWDTSGCKWPQVSPTHSSSVSWGAEASMSPNHLLYNHYMQNSSAQIVPNFVMLGASYDLDLSRLNQNVTHCSSLEGNGAAKPFPMDGVKPWSGTTTNITSPSSDDSVQEIPRPKVHAGHCPNVDTPYRHRGARKPNPGNAHGAFRCPWKDCPSTRTFSRKGVLKRHIETQHVNPRSFGCPTCGRLFSRKDNMNEQLGRVHWQRV